MQSVGDRVDDKYELTRLIGEGGMGAVFEASHLRIRKKKVAIKFLHPNIASDHESLIRFKREAEATAAVDHPGIIDVQDIGQLDDGSPFMVLEFLHGQSLGDALSSSCRERQGLSINYVVYVACKVLSALSAAHHENIIHRDLKPDNIFLVDIGVERPDVKLLDFGIARFKGPTAEASTLTSTGAVIGTPYYLSPEQAQGHKDIDHRTDIFSMGAILYQCLTGERPFTGPNYPRLIVQLCTEQPPPFSNYVDGIPEKLQAVVLRALQKDRSQRHQSAAELFDDLIEFGNLVELNTVIPPRSSASRKPKNEISPQSGGSWVEHATPQPAHQISEPPQIQSNQGPPTVEEPKRIAPDAQDQASRASSIETLVHGDGRGPNAVAPQPSKGVRWPTIALFVGSVIALVIAVIAVSVTVYVLTRSVQLPGPVGAKVEDTTDPEDLSSSHPVAPERGDGTESLQDPVQSASLQPTPDASTSENDEAQSAQVEGDGGPDAATEETETASLPNEQTKSGTRPPRPRVEQTKRPRETRPVERRPPAVNTRPRPPQYGGTPSYGREVTPSSPPTYGREIR